MRIVKSDPGLPAVKRGKQINVFIDGRPTTAFLGETVAAVLLAEGIRTFRRTLQGEPRGIFCGMGVCYDCLVTVNGLPDVRACMTPVAEDMRVDTLIQDDSDPNETSFPEDSR